MRSVKVKKILATVLAAAVLTGSAGTGAVLAVGRRLQADNGRVYAEELKAPAEKSQTKQAEQEFPVIHTEVYPKWEAPDFAAEDVVYTHYDYSTFEAAVESFLEAVGLKKGALQAAPSKTVDETQMREALDKILAEYDRISTLASYNQYEYTQDVSNEKVKDEMNYMDKLTPDVFNLLLETLQGVQKNETLGPVLEAVLGEKKSADLEETDTMTPRQKEIREEETRLEQEFDNFPEEGKADEKGEIYLKLVALRNEYAAEAGYKDYHEMDLAETYGRDFSDEELEDYFAAVKKYFAPLYMTLGFFLNWSEIESYRYPASSDLESLVGDYLGNISSELLDSYHYLLDNKLFTLGQSPNNEDVSYTINVPEHHSALIFIKDRGDYDNLSTLIHEFGHFNTAVRTTGDSFFSHSNIDLAEIHSQGLELLFLPYASYMYGDAADSARAMVLLNMVWAVLTGCLYHEFEIYAYTTPNVTLEQLRKEYVKLAESYLPGANSEDDWMFWHIYHAPFYYISYSLSAMASLSLLPGMRSDWRGTVDKYLHLTACGEESYPFRETLKVSGLPDVFEEETVQKIASEISLWKLSPVELQPENSGDEEGGEEQTRPTIDLPEFGQKTEPSEEADSGRKQEQKQEKKEKADYRSPGEEIWKGDPDAGFFRKIAELPKAVFYIITGDVWDDIFSSFTDAVTDLADEL